MTKNIARTFIAILIAAVVVGAYLIVANNGSPPPTPGEAAPLLAH